MHGCAARLNLLSGR